MKQIVAIGFIISSLLVTSLTFAQTNPTTTPAPTKTPLANATPTSALAITPTATFSGVLDKAFTQDDLEVLVGNVQRPNGITWFNNQLFTACNGDYTLYKIDAETGQTVTLVFGVQNAHTLFAEQITSGYNLWIPDFDTNKLLWIDQRGNAPRTIATDKLDGPWGIDMFSEQEFLVTNIRANNIVAVSRDGITREVARGLRSPAGIVVDGDYIYVVNNGSARQAIQWFSRADVTMDTVARDIAKPLVSGLQSASGLVKGADGYLYFSYSLGTRGVIGRIQPAKCRDGGCTNEDVEIVVYTDLQAPLAGLTVSPDMRIFFHTIFRPELYWVDLYK